MVDRPIEWATRSLRYPVGAVLGSDGGPATAPSTNDHEEIEAAKAQVKIDYQPSAALPTVSGLNVGKPGVTVLFPKNGTTVSGSSFALSGMPAAQAGGRHTVTLTLVAGQTSANDHLNFNGYARGAMTVTVPIGWTVVIQYANSTVARHSLLVTWFAAKQPDKAVPPAFKGASTKDPVDGVGAGHKEVITFVAERPGQYEFMCGVLGHAAAGMWNFFVVSPTAKLPASCRRGALRLEIR